MFWRYFRKHPLATRLTLLIIFSSTVITVIAIAIMLNKQYRMDVKGLETRIQTVQSVSLPSLSQSLWEFNDENVRIMLNSIMQMEDMLYAEVHAYNWDGSKRLIQTGEKPELAAQNTIVSEVDIRNMRSFSGEKEVLGSLLVIASLDGVNAKLWQGARFIVISTAITIFVITVMILFLIKHLLTRHLLKISSYTQSLRLDNDVQPLILDRPAQNVEDELDALVIAINQMHRDLLNQQKQQIQLLEERIEAEAASQTKSRFLATMSHEIRTPMNGIIGILGLIEMGELDKKQSYYLSIVKQSSETLLAIINDILDFSRIEAGKLELVSSDFNLENLIEECAQLYTAAVKENGLNLLVLLPHDVPRYLRGDALRIRQVILNFLSNALKFTRQGYITLSVSVVEQGSSGTVSVRFAVADSGVGIEKEGVESLFEPFEQAEHGRKQGRSGTGLGLAICKRLVDMMGGDFGVSSELGEGSEFWFTVPLHYSPEEHRKYEKDIIAIRSYLAGKKLLLVDDDQRFSDMIASYCKTESMEFLHCSTLSECKSLITEQSPAVDILMIDMGLPDGSGIILIRWLREQAAYAETPIILLTAMADTLSDFEKQSLAVEMAMSKPVTPKRLRYAMSNLSGYREPVQEVKQFAQMSDLSILVAEDNKMNIAVIKAMLEQFKTRVEVTENGKQVLDFYKMSGRDIDIVLMDCEMPYMDGFAATKAIRQWEKLEEWPPVFIVALTAHHTTEHHQLAIEAGMDEYLAKPVNMQALEKILLSVLANKKRNERNGG